MATQRQCYPEAKWSLNTVEMNGQGHLGLCLLMPCLPTTSTRKCSFPMPPTTPAYSWEYKGLVSAWISSTDFQSHGKDSIFLVVDHLTKYVSFMPLNIFIWPPSMLNVIWIMLLTSKVSLPATTVNRNHLSKQVFERLLLVIGHWTPELHSLIYSKRWPN